MNVNVPTRPAAFAGPAPSPRKSHLVGWTVFTVILLLLGVGIWYWFFGKKPRVVLSVPLQSEIEAGGTGMFSLGDGELFILNGGEVKLISVPNRAVKWTAKIPPVKELDPAWRTAINARFVRLHQWAEDLTGKRANLKTPAETKAFNEEAAKYQAELAAVRAEVSAQAQPEKPAEPEKGKKAPPATAKAPAAPAPAAPVKKEAAAAGTGLKAITDPEIILIEQRMKRRTAQMAKLEASIKKQQAAAKTPTQIIAVEDDAVRLNRLQEEHKAEAEMLAKLRGTEVKPAEPAPTEEPEEPAVEPLNFWHRAEPYAAVVGTDVWLVDGERIVSFERASGKLKGDVTLAGPVLRAWGANGDICVEASAGPEARQITRINAKTGLTSLYLPAGSVEQPINFLGEGGTRPNIQRLRTEFTGPLLQVNIHLLEKKLTPRDAIKPGSEKEAIKAFEEAPAHSTEELLAAVKMLNTQGASESGLGKEWVDESTYEVTLRRPFDSLPEWKGTVTGRVHVLSTAHHDLLIAGTKLLVFNRANEKAWEATLGAPLPIYLDEVTEQPALEVGENLYFADGAFLTAFHAATGKVLWRLPSIGIYKLQVDGDGHLYVQSRNLATESLTYVFDESFQDTEPVTMKVSPTDGAIEWQVPKYENLWVTGGDIYVLREVIHPTDIENQVFDPSKVPEARVRIYKLSRGKGTPIWDWYQPRRPHAVQADGKHVSLLFGSEFQLIHSIAL